MQGAKIAVTVFLTVNSINDIRKGEIFLIPSAAMFVSGLLISVLVYNVSPADVIKAIVPGIILILLSALCKGRIGCGDGVIACASGAWLGLEETLYMLTAAFFTASLAGIVLILSGSKKRTLPFVPFMLLGEVFVWMI